MALGDLELFGVKTVPVSLSTMICLILHKRLTTLAEFIYPETVSGRFLGNGLTTLAEFIYPEIAQDWFLGK